MQLCIVPVDQVAVVDGTVVGGCALVKWDRVRLDQTHATHSLRVVKGRICSPKKMLGLCKECRHERGEEKKQRR